MQYRKAFLMNVCLLLCVASSAQLTESGGQYPFVHYTPKDGLVSNRVRNIYQDSKGRLYFSTLNGLSVYDGARFTNYTTEDGLHSDVINCVMEMGDDSVWVAANTNRVDCIVRGKLKPLTLKDSATPVINLLCRNAAGELYAAADDGLFLFQQNTFEKIPLTDFQGEDINSYVVSLVPYGNYLLLMRDYGLVATAPKALYLYDYTRKKIVSQTSGIVMVSVAASKDGAIWISTDKGIMQLNAASLNRGEIKPEPLPPVYRHFAKNRGYIFFDNYNNCWVTSGVSSLKKCDVNGDVTEYTTASGLNSLAISYVFHDREGAIWLASNGGGVEKLMHTNLSLIEKPFGFLSVSNSTLSGSASAGLWFYSAPEKKIIRFTDIQKAETWQFKNAEGIGLLAATAKTLFGIHSKKVFRLNLKAGIARPEVLFTDSSENKFVNTLIDKNGTLILSGTAYLTAINDNFIFRAPFNYFSDQLATDREGNIWAATRSEHLFQFSTHPENTNAYLKKEAVFEKELKGLEPRSVTVDNNGNIWIGTRYKGLYVFQHQKEKLNLLYHLSSKNGLTDNFISWLACDSANNIWAVSPSGLDKIHIANKEPVIENLTRQNNIYQYIYSVFIGKNNTAWALSSGGLIRVTPESPVSSGYIPRLIMTQIRNGATVINDSSAVSLSYKQNNLNFYFAAPSFLDEKQILYSYQLQGSGNKEWTEPDNNAFATFIDLRPGNYTLNIKAKFPAGRYPEQTMQYKFSITPPWWQTWWFRLLAGLLITGLLIMAVRFYYRRKLEKQKTILEKQQAVEKERTRIATDMHDDLGAGLSKIRFMSETVQRNISEEAHQPILQNIASSSVELVDKFNEIIWAMNEKNNSLEDLLYYMRNYTARYSEENNLAYNIIIPEQIQSIIISGEMRRHIFLTVKECLHNVVKHAGAKNVRFTVQLDNSITITVHDDGNGFDANEMSNAGNGLRSMEQRMKNINGKLIIENESGTLLKITVPFPAS